MKRSKAGTQWFLTYRDLGPPSLRKGRNAEHSGGKERKRRPRPDWDETIHDLSQYKLTEAEIEERKQAVVSKNAVRVPRSDVENWVPQFGYDERGRFHSYIAQPRLISEESSQGGQRHQEKPRPWRPGGTPNFLEHLEHSRSPLRQPMRERQVADDEGQGDWSETKERGEEKELAQASQQETAKDESGPAVGVTGVVDFDEEVSRFEARQRLIQSLAKRKKRGDGGSTQFMSETEASQGEARRGGSEERGRGGSDGSGRGGSDERSRGGNDGRVGRGVDEGLLGELERGFRDLEAKIDSHAVGGLRGSGAVGPVEELSEAEGPGSSGMGRGGSVKDREGKEGTGMEERAESRGGEQEGGQRHDVGSPVAGEEVSAAERGSLSEQSGFAPRRGSTPADDRSGAATDGLDHSRAAVPQSDSAVEHSERPEHQSQGETRSEVAAPGGTAAGVEVLLRQYVAGGPTEPSGAAAHRSVGAPMDAGNGDRQSVPAGNAAHGSDPGRDRGNEPGEKPEPKEAGAEPGKAPGGTVPGRRPAVVERTPFEAGRPSALAGVSPVDTMAHLERLSQGLQTCLAENRSLKSDFAEFKAHASTILTGLQLHVQKLLEVLPPGASHVAPSPPPVASPFRYESRSAEPGRKSPEASASKPEFFEISLPSFDEDLVDSIPLPSYAELRSLPLEKPPLVQRHQRRSEAVRVSTGLAPVPRSLPAILKTSLRSSHASR